MAYQFGDDISVYIEDLADYRAVTPNVAVTTEYDGYRCVVEDVQASLYQGDECLFVVSGLRMKVGFFKDPRGHAIWYGTTEVGTLHCVDLARRTHSTRDFGVEADIRVSPDGNYVVVVAVDEHQGGETFKATLYKVVHPKRNVLYDREPEPMSIWEVAGPEVDVPPFYSHFDVSWDPHGEGVSCIYKRGLCSHPEMADRYETDLCSEEFDKWQEWLDEQTSSIEPQYHGVMWEWKLTGA